MHIKCVKSFVGAARWLRSGTSGAWGRLGPCLASAEATRVALLALLQPSPVELHCQICFFRF